MLKIATVNTMLHVFLSIRLRNKSLLAPVYFLHWFPSTPSCSRALLPLKGCHDTDRIMWFVTQQCPVFPGSWSHDCLGESIPSLKDSKGQRNNRCRLQYLQIIMNAVTLKNNGKWTLHVESILFPLFKLSWLCEPYLLSGELFMISSMERELKIAQI